MIIDLSGSTALVTGSTQGIGFEVAKGLAASGARVIVNGRSEQGVLAAVQKLAASVPNGNFAMLAADVATAEGAQQALQTFPEVDVLINNLGIYGAKPALQITDDDWRRYFEINVLAAVRLTREYLPRMMGQGWGRVQYLASDSAVATPVEMIHYGMTKTALLGVSRGFAKEAAGTGVTVNSMIAGPTHTAGVEDFVYELVDTALPWEEAQREFMRLHRPQSLLKRLIEPEEIANLVVYLSSRQSSATTGAAVRVDGGYIDSILP